MTATPPSVLRVQDVLDCLGIEHAAPPTHLPGPPDLFLPAYNAVLFIHKYDGQSRVSGEAAARAALKSAGWTVYVVRTTESMRLKQLSSTFISRLMPGRSRCHDCVNVTRLGRSHCELHDSKGTGVGRRLKGGYTDAPTPSRRRALGLCVCGRVVPASGAKQCSACRKRGRLRGRKWGARNALIGLCRHCMNPAEPGRIRCEKHLAIARDFAATYRGKITEARKAAGQCIDCAEPNDRTTLRCSVCTERMRRTARRRERQCA